MRRTLYLIIVCAFSLTAWAQHTFQGTSLSDALIELDQSSERYDISFVYDELEDFPVSKTIMRGRSLPDAVREVCGFYPIRVTVKGRDILVECIHKERTKLTGRLIDSEGRPVAYANIVLLQPSDSSLLTGGVSNEAGDFVIPCVASQALVRISCVGLKSLEQLLPVAPVGTLCMQIENHHLRNVSVSGHPPIISYQGGRLRYIVRQDRFAKGLLAIELLSRVPMVSVIDRQPSILGKGPARYMLNGRVMELGDDAMQQKLWLLRAEDIDRIEVISVPSGRYQNEYGGGFINIVTNQSLGWQGDLGGQVTYGEDWSGQLNALVNYASEKLDWSADISGSQTTNLEETYLDYQHFFPRSNDDYSYYSNRGRDKALKASSEFRFTPWRSLELGGLLSFQAGQSFNDLTDISQNDIDKNKEPQPTKDIHSTSSLRPSHPARTFGLTAYSEWHWDDTGKTSCLTYNHYVKGEKTVSVVNSSQMQENGEYNAIGTVANKSDNTYYIQSVKFDNTLPNPFATFEAGIAYSIIDNYADIEYLKEKAGLLSTVQNEYHSYEEKALAYYLSVQKELAARLTLYAGLRYERSWVKRRAEEGIGGKKYSLNGRNSSFHHYLPTLRLSHQFRDRRQWGIQWGISIHRPYFYELSPNFLYRNLDASISGNPVLQLGTTQYLEVNYSDSRHLYATFYHQHQTNQVITMTTAHRTMPVDGYISDKTGLLLNYRRNFGDRVNLNAECEGYYYNIEDKYAHDDYDISKSTSEFVDRNKTWVETLPPLWGWGGRFCLGADLYLDHSRTLLLNVRYSQWLADFIGMDKYKAYALPEMSLHYTLLDSRLKLSLTVKDPFRQYVTDMTRLYIGDAEHYHTRHHVQSVSLTATYAIGERKVRRIHHDMKDTESKRAERQ